MKITIKHQEEKTYHTYSVNDPFNLNSAEVRLICGKMNVRSLFINGKYYEKS